MRLLILISFSLFLSCSLLAQAKQRKADDHFAKLEYFSAAPIYEELARKTISGKGNINWENVRKAAISNKNLYQFNTAKYYYSKLHETNRLTEVDYVEYIDLLRVIGQYEVADQLLADANLVYPTNNFVQLLKDKNKDFGRLLADSSIYFIEPLSINSGLGDFCPAFYDQGILFMSKAKNAGFLNSKYGWDNSYFINMLYSPYDIDSSLVKPKVLKDAFFSRAHDGPVSFSPDGNTMVITKNTLGKHNDQEIVVLGIYFSKKVNGIWQEVKPFPFNNPTYNVGHACFSADGKQIYFSSKQPGGFGGADLYYSDKIGEMWTEPVNLGPKINTDQDELFPHLTATTLYFSSRGHFGIGGLDVFSTDLSMEGKVLNMGAPINTSYDDFGIIALPSEKGGFFSSNRGDFVDRVYAWTRKDPMINFEGTVLADYQQDEPIPNHYVLFEDLTTNQTDTLFTDSLGKFNTQLFVNHSYNFTSSKQYFKLKEELPVETAGITRDTLLTGELVFQPLIIDVMLKVVERGTNLPIKSSKVTVTNPLSQKDTVLYTNDEGIAILVVDRFTEYEVHATKRGYVDDQTIFQTTDEDDKVIQLLLQLPLIKKGDKFKLENIFYDYNKSTLRPESMASLDKLAEFIIENKLKIELAAHTDARGSVTGNQKLSQARAQSCVDYLIKKGVPTTSIYAKGYGESMLLNRCKDGVTCSEEEHQANRRTEIKIL